MILKLNDYFCTDFLIMADNMLKESIIDTDSMTEHFTKCSICESGIKTLTKDFFSKLNPVQLLNFTKQTFKRS